MLVMETNTVSVRAYLHVFFLKPITLIDKDCFIWCCLSSSRGRYVQSRLVRKKSPELQLLLLLLLYWSTRDLARLLLHACEQSRLQINICITIWICELWLQVLVLHADAVFGLVANDRSLLEYVAVLRSFLLNTHYWQLRWHRCVDAHRQIRSNERLVTAVSRHCWMEKLQAVSSTRIVFVRLFHSDLVI